MTDNLIDFANGKLISQIIDFNCRRFGVLYFIFHILLVFILPEYKENRLFMDIVGYTFLGIFVISTIIIHYNYIKKELKLIKKNEKYKIISWLKLLFKSDLKLERRKYEQEQIKIFLDNEKIYDRESIIMIANNIKKREKEIANIAFIINLIITILISTVQLIVQPYNFNNIQEILSLLVFMISIFILIAVIILVIVAIINFFIGKNIRIDRNKRLYNILYDIAIKSKQTKIYKIKEVPRIF